MGGRGSTSTAGTIKTGSQTGHYQVEFKPTFFEKLGHVQPYLYEEAVRFTAGKLGVSQSEAEEYNKTVAAFTDTSYAYIRQYQRGERNEERYGKMEAALEGYIEKAPKWNGGMTYRGVAAPTVPKVGDVLDMGGTSSWSTKKDEALSFADTAEYDGYSKVVFRSARQTKGTSVKHLSAHAFEDEVTVSKKARYKVTGTSKVGDTTYVDVREL